MSTRSFAGRRGALVATRRAACGVARAAACRPASRSARLGVALALVVASWLLASCGGDAAGDAPGGNGGGPGGSGWSFVEDGQVVRPDSGGTAPEDSAAVPQDVGGWETAACRSDADCQAPTPYCDIGSGVCVACRTSNDCGGRTCSAGVCEGDAAGCQPNARVCVGSTVVYCDASGQVSDRVDCAPNVCVRGVCAMCYPGQTSCQANDIVQCMDDASGYLLVESCPEGCAAGQCVACYPGTGRCEDGKALRCQTDGSGWRVEQDCAEYGFDCVQGTCVSPCATDPKTQTNAGCDFWAVDLDNAYYRSPDGDVYDAQSAQFAVIVSNTDELATAEVTVTMPDDRTIAQSIAPRTVGTFLLPSTFGLDGSGVSRNAFRVQSNRPVTVYQFNPLANVDVFSNDASVLLPTPSLGTEYYVASHVENGAYRAYVTVVAVEAGETAVTIRPTIRTAAGAGVPAIPAGTEQTVTLQRGDVLNVESDQVGGDLSGTYLRTTQRAVVFAGHEAAAPGEECCLDHLEQQFLPISRWGRSYIATHSMQRSLEKDHWLILSATAGNHVRIEPAVASVPATIDPGVPVRFTSDRDFVVTADEPVLLVQYLASSFEIIAPMNPDSCFSDSQCHPGYSCFFSCEPPECDTDAECPSGHTCIHYSDWSAGVCEPIGDPAMILSVPTEQFRKEFIFLTPNSYLEDYVNVVAPTGAVVQLDGQTVAPAQFATVGASGHGVYRTRVSDGVHVVKSDQPVGLVVYGYDDDVSYGYPGGLGLEALTDTAPR